MLAVGEVGAILVRGLFGLIVGICDVLAACMCCCRVPFAERPDRDGYTYSTLAVRDEKASKRLQDRKIFQTKSFSPTVDLFSLPGKKNKVDDQDSHMEKLSASSSDKPKLDKDVIRAKMEEAKAAKRKANQDAKDMKKAMRKSISENNRKAKEQ